MEIKQDMDQAILVMRSAGKWLFETGKNPSKWWQLKNLNREFLLQYAKPEEFYIGLINRIPVVAAVLQFSQKAQDWQNVNKNKQIDALYIHWLCVGRKFAGKRVPKQMIDFAAQKARDRNVHFLRADTTADAFKLRRIYENLGFQLLGTRQEDYRETAFYQKRV